MKHGEKDSNPVEKRCACAAAGILLVSSLAFIPGIVPASRAEGGSSPTVSYSTTFAPPSASPTTAATGNMKVTYDTSGNATYTVTIPTSVTWTGMGVGAVQSGTNATYKVNVKGYIGVNQKVTVTRPSGLHNLEISSNSKSKGDVKATITATGVYTTSTTAGSSSTETITGSAKNDWSADDCATMNSENTQNVGVTAADTVTLSGTARYGGEYTSTVTYSAALVDASQS